MAQLLELVRPPNPFRAIPPDLKKMVRHIESNNPNAQQTIFYNIALKLELVDKRDTVYDLGCGNGYHLPELSLAAYKGKIYGVEIAPTRVANAKKVASNLNNVEIYHMDARKLQPPLIPNTADKVLLLEVLGLVPKDFAHNMINEAVSAAKPQGKIVATMLSKEFFLELEIANKDQEYTNNLEKDIAEYAPGLIKSTFTKEEIKKSHLGTKCSFEIYNVSHKSLDPDNILEAPPHLLDKTERYLVVATKN